MKKILILILGAAALCGCSNVSKPDTLKGLQEEKLARAQTFADTLAALDGTFIGGIFNNRANQYPAEVIGSDKAEMLRGIRTVLSADTANRSYLSGLQMGLEIMDIYCEHSSKEPLSKAKLLAAIEDAFRLDSLNLNELRQLQMQFMQIAAELDQRAEKRANAEVYNSRQAQENRMMGDAVLAKFKTNPDFNEVGSDGLLQKITQPGTGAPLNPNLPITVAITERRADSGAVIRAIAPMQVLAGKPYHPVLESVIPYMSMNETSVFVVPYRLAYGVEGEPQSKIGPCEIVIAEVSISPAE